MHGDQRSRGSRWSVAFLLGARAAPIAVLAAILCQSSSAQLSNPLDHAPKAAGILAKKVRYAENKPAAHQASVPVERVAQEKANWCWAACAQMIHAQNGRTYTQAELARHVQGEDEEWGPGGRAAAYRELLIALSPDFAPDLLRQVRQGVFAHLNGEEELELDPLGALMAQFAHHSVNSDDLVEALRVGSPVLVVLDEGPDAGFEHAYVVRGAGWARSAAAGVNREVERIVPKRIRLPGLAKRGLDVIDEVVLKHELVWVELIDPDPAAVEDPGAVGEGEPLPPPAFLRLSGKQLSERVRLILTPQKAREILMAQYEIIRPKNDRRMRGAR